MTLYAKISELEVRPGRQRREFKLEAINELGTSITNIGLLQAPVVRIEGGKPILVAGERRVRAMSDLHDLGVIFNYGDEEVPHGMIPYVTLGSLDPLQAWEAELEENIRRVDLTWQERAAATASLLELRQAQATDSGTAPPTIESLTIELRTDLAGAAKAQNIYTGKNAVKEELIVSRFLKDPEIKAAPSMQEAIKILKKRDETARREVLAEAVGRTFTASSHVLEQVDFLEWQATAKPAQFDIILTDPPYGMGADEFGDSGQGVSAAAHFYEDSYENWLALMQVFPHATYTLAREHAHAYVFCDIDRFPELRTRMSEAGWKVHRTPLIWHNPDGFRAPWPKQGPQRRYELILYAVKGDKPVTAVREDVLKYGKDSSLGHPAQKPVALLVDLLKRSAQPGDRVFDPCAGSGATIEAAHELKLTCVALEKIPSAYGIAVKRLQSLIELNKELF